MVTETKCAAFDVIYTYLHMFNLFYQRFFADVTKLWLYVGFKGTRIDLTMQYGDTCWESSMAMKKPLSRQTCCGVLEY